MESITNGESRRGYILAWIYLTLSLLPGCLLLPLGLNEVDEPYQILIGFDPTLTPQAPFFTVLTHYIGTLCGWHLLAFRAIAWSLTVVAIVLGGWACCRATRRGPLSICVTATVILLAGLRAHTELAYSWDSFTIAITTAILVFALSYRGAPSLWKLAVITLLSGISAGIRLPNAVTLPVVAIFLSVDYKLPLPRRVAAVSFYLAGAVLVFLAGIWWIFGQPSVFIDALRDHPYGAHNINHMTAYCVSVVSEGLLGGLIFAFIIGFGLYLGRSRDKLTRYGGLAAVTAIGVAAMIFITPLSPYSNSTSLPIRLPSLLVIALIILWLAAPRGESAESRGVRSYTIPIFLLAMAIVPFAGSNTAIVKCLSWSVIPILYGYLRPIWGKALDRVMICAAISLGSINCWQSYNLRHFDDGWGAPHAYTLNPRLNGIRPTLERASIHDKVYSATLPYTERGYKVVVVGEGFDRRVYEYLYDSANPLYLNAWGDAYELDNEAYVNWVRAILADSSHTVVIYTWDHDREQPSAMQAMLDSVASPIAIVPYTTVYAVK